MTSKISLRFDENGVSKKNSIFQFTPPDDLTLKRLLRKEFVKALETVSSLRKFLWSRSVIDPFFQETFYKRNEIGCSEKEIKRIEELQASIKKRNQTAIQTRDYGINNANPLKFQRPVVDSLK